MPLLGAIAGCHCSVLWLSGRGAIAGGKVTTNFGGVDVVPLQGAIAVCLVAGEGDDQLWRSGRGAIAGCRCSVLWWGGGDDQLWGSGRGAFDNTKIGFCYLGSMLV